MGLFQSKNAQTAPSKEQIATAIKKRGSETGVRYLCPICQHGQWDIAGVRAHQLEQESKVAPSGQEYLPSAVLICRKCGFCAEFSLLSLGLLS